MASGQGTRMLRHPTVNRDLVAFEYAGDLWVVSRNGGTARRLTATPRVEIDPYFSPDGSKVAFSATAAGNTDVYVMSVSGGDPKRLTYNPVIDQVRGWTPDGQRVLFSSVRADAPLESHWRFGRSVLPAECRNRCNCQELLRDHIPATVSEWLMKNFRRRCFPRGKRQVSGGIIGEAGHIQYP